MSVPEIRIALLGYGNVGTGVMRILSEHAPDIEARLGARLHVQRVLVRDPAKPRGAVAPAGLLTDRVEDILDDPDVRIVVELMGGLEPARDYVLRALRAGKHVVTANKALLATHGEEIFAAASEHKVDVLYEGAVGGGIPIIRSLREALASDRVRALAGILNGTTNFILSEMSQTGRPFDAVLREAQDLGFAEADPTQDVDGFDAAQKLCLIAAISFGTRVRPEEVFTEGIREVEAEDLAYAHEFGYVLKLLAIGRHHDDGSVELRVHPTFIPKTSLLAHVSGPFNAVQVQSEALGVSLFYGQGAGSLPTGAAVVADIIDAGRNLLLATSGRIPHLATRDAFLRELPRRSMDRIECGYYLRFSVRDEPGVLGRIAGILGDYRISIAAVVQNQRGQGAGPVPVVVTTHEVREKDVRGALDVIDRLPFVARPTRLIRIGTDLPGVA